MRTSIYRHFPEIKGKIFTISRGKSFKIDLIFQIKLTEKADILIYVILDVDKEVGVRFK